MNEPIGTDRHRLLRRRRRCWAFFSLVLPAIAMGNTVVAVPSDERTRTIIGDLYQVFDTSDLPGGVVNIVAGRPAELARRWPSTTTSMRSGASATRRTRRW